MSLLVKVLLLAVLLFLAGRAVLAMARAVMEDREERRGGRLHRDRDPRPGRHLYWNEDVEDARWEDVEE